MSGFKPMSYPCQPARFEITGETEGRRFVVWVEDTRELVIHSVFRMVAWMAWAALVENEPHKGVVDGFIPREKLLAEPLATKYLYRVRQDIVWPGHEDWPVFESDGYCRVRLLVTRPNIHIDQEGLAALPDLEFQQIASSLALAFEREGKRVCR